MTNRGSICNISIVIQTALYMSNVTDVKEINYLKSGILVIYCHTRINLDTKITSSLCIQRRYN
jgi:hypothetical protein